MNYVQQHITTVCCYDCLVHQCMMTFVFPFRHLTESTRKTCSILYHFFVWTFIYKLLLLVSRRLLNTLEMVSIVLSAYPPHRLPIPSEHVATYFGLIPGHSTRNVHIVSPVNKLYVIRITRTFRNVLDGVCKVFYFEAGLIEIRVGHKLQCDDG